MPSDAVSRWSRRTCGLLEATAFPGGRGDDVRPPTVTAVGLSGNDTFSRRCICLPCGAGDSLRQTTPCLLQPVHGDSSCVGLSSSDCSSNPMPGGVCLAVTSHPVIQLVPIPSDARRTASLAERSDGLKE